MINGKKIKKKRNKVMVMIVKDVVYKVKVEEIWMSLML
jgi:hypothetical protein